MTLLITSNPLFGPSTETGKVFATTLRGANSTNINKGSDFLKKYWDRYEKQHQKRSAVLNGNVFETLVAILLQKKNLTPLFHQAHITFVPNVKFDLVVYSKEFGPIVLSIKTSLRERYKQVDLEGWILKQVHRQARTYLITADEKAATKVNTKIKKGEVMGIEEVVYAFGKEMDELVLTLGQLTLKKPGTADIMKGKILT